MKVLLMQINTIPQYNIQKRYYSSDRKNIPSFKSAVKTCAIPALFVSGLGLLVHEIKNNPKQIEENKEVAELNAKIDENNVKIAREKEAKMLKDLDRALKDLAEKKTLDAQTCQWLIDLCNSDNMKDPKFARAVTNQLMKAQQAMIKNMSKQERKAFINRQEKAYQFLKKKIAQRYIQANKELVSISNNSSNQLVENVTTISTYQNPQILTATEGNALTRIEESEADLARPFTQEDYEDFETIYTAIFETQKEAEITRTQKPHYKAQKLPIPTTMPVYAGFLFIFLSAILGVGEILGIGKEE